MEWLLAVSGGKRITSNASYVIILLFQVTSKVTHYFFFHLLTDSALCEHDLTVVLVYNPKF